MTGQGWFTLAVRFAVIIAVAVIPIVWPF